MIDKLELYHHGSSVCAAKVRFYLAEKDLPWEGHYIDILKGEQFTPDYIKLNPKAVVPTLIHDGTVIRDSTNICEYLDDVFPERQVRLETPGKPPPPRVTLALCRGPAFSANVHLDPGTSPG